jgi:hypothetical protein
MPFTYQRPNARGSAVMMTYQNFAPPLPVLFPDYTNFAVAALNNEWELTKLNCCAYCHGVLVTVKGKKYVYVAGYNLYRAYWFWDSAYSKPPGPNMGAVMTPEAAKAAKYVNGMFLVCPDSTQPDGGFSKFGFHDEY